MTGEICKSNTVTWRMLGVPLILIVIGILLSSVVHEIGHMLFFSMFGVESYFVVVPEYFAIGVQVLEYPSFMVSPEFTLYSQIAGPLFASVMCLLLGKFVKEEMYIAGIVQGVYIPLEVLYLNVPFMSQLSQVNLIYMYVIVTIVIFIITIVAGVRLMFRIFDSYVYKAVKT